MLYNYTNSERNIYKNDFDTFYKKCDFNPVSFPVDYFKRRLNKCIRRSGGIPIMFEINFAMKQRMLLLALFGTNVKPDKYYVMDDQKEDEIAATLAVSGNYLGYDNIGNLENAIQIVLGESCNSLKDKDSI